MSEQEQGFDLNAAANEIISNDSQEANAPTENESTTSDNQAIEPQEKVAGKELSPEEILKAVGEEKEDPKASEEILNQINALGLVHNGAPFKIESLAQAKELLQKAYDYTKKTMAHSDEVKAWKETQAKAETEWKEKHTQLQQYEEKLVEINNENQIMGSVLTELQNSDPDFFNEIAARYQAELNRRNQVMPYMKQFENKFNQLNGKIQSLEQQKQQSELTGIKQNWESDLQTTQGKYAPQLAKLGVKVDWDKVKKTWSSDATNSMSVEQALFAAYGKEITQANESYKKLLETKNKTSNTMLKRTGAGSNPGGKEETKNFGGNYEALLRASI